MPSKRRQQAGTPANASSPIQGSPNLNRTLNNSSNNTNNSTVIQVKDSETEKNKIIKEGLKNTPLFKGEESVRHHFSLLESRAKIYGWSDDILTTITRLTIAGNALEYLTSIEEGRTFKYQEIKDKLNARFDRTPEIVELKTKLKNLRKGNKSVRTYAEDIRGIAAQLYAKTGTNMSDRELFDHFERGLKYEDQKTLALMDITTFEGGINKLATLEAYSDRAELDLHGREKNHLIPKVNQALALGDFSEELKKQNKVETDKLGQELKDLKEIVAQLAKSVASGESNKNKSVNNNNSRNVRGPRYGNYNNFVCHRCQRRGHFISTCIATTNVFGQPLPPKQPGMQPFRPAVPYQPMFAHLQPMQPESSHDPPPVAPPAGEEQLALPAPPPGSD